MSLSIAGGLYALLMGVVVSGMLDGAATGLPHGPQLIALGLALLFAGCILLSRYWQGLMRHSATILLLSLAVTAGTHLTLPAVERLQYPVSPLYPFFYAYLIAFAASGSLSAWLGAAGLFCLTEIIAVTVQLFSGPPGTAVRDPQLALGGLGPQMGAILGVSILAYAITAGRGQRRGQGVAGDAQAQPPRPATANRKTALHHTGAGQLVPEKADTVIMEVSETLSSTHHSLKEVLSSVVYFMSRNFKSYSALGFIYAPEKNAFILDAFHSRSVAINPSVEIPLGQGIIGTVGKDKQSFLSGDLSLYNAEIPYYTAAETVNSILAFPIISEHKELLGALVLDSKDKNAFNEQHKETLKRFSGLAAALIYNVRMRLFHEEATREFRMFYEASQKFTTALKTSQVLEILFRMIGQITSYTRMLGIAFNEESQSGTVRTVVGSAGEIPEGLTFPINDGMYSMVYRSKQAVNVADFQQYKGTYYRFMPNEPHNPHIRSLIIIPLTNDRQQCRGIVSVENNLPGHFQGAMEQILYTLAGNASVAYERAMLYQQMELLATTDGLTGLSNHRTFQDMLMREIDRTQRYNRSVALLLFDIDHFKKFNDTYGHPVGDQVLKEIARCLRGSLRKNDTPARYGGEEFVVILPETDERNAMISAERIRSTIEARTIVNGGHQLKVTVSIGCATLPQLAHSQQELIDFADKALYFSKEHGRNRATLYQPGM